MNWTVESVFNTLGSTNRLTNCVKSKDYHKKDERGSFKNPDSGHEILLGGRPGCFKLSGRGVWIPSWSQLTKEPTSLCSHAAPNGTEAEVAPQIGLSRSVGCDSTKPQCEQQHLIRVSGAQLVQSEENTTRKKYEAGRHNLIICAQNHDYVSGGRFFCLFSFILRTGANQEMWAESSD